MDCAKGIGIVVAHRRHIVEFEGVDTLRVPSPPLILIPATAGTSANVSQFVIISNQDERMKFSIVSKTAVPDVSLIDPETTASMDPFPPPAPASTRWCMPSRRSSPPATAR